MDHFAIHAWVDFARGVLPPKQKLAMQQHLNEGCAECGKLLKNWELMTNFFAREQFYRPSDAVVRQVKAQFTINRPVPARSRLAEMAEMIFDSLVQPAPQGVRSAGASPRQLIYRKGDCCIDMRIEHKSGSGRIALVGQVLDSGAANRGLENIPVLLLNAGYLVEQTATNRFGEFQLEFEAAENLQLSIAMKRSNSFVVPIPSLQEARGSFI